MPKKKKVVEKEVPEPEHIPESRISHMRRFNLVRDEDESGVSGTGVVAEGVIFSNGYVVMNWISQKLTISTYHSIDGLEDVHSHGGKTRVVFIDARTHDKDD